VLRVALLTEGTYPYHPGGVSVWCDQLVRGMAPHRFTIYSIVAASDFVQRGSFRRSRRASLNFVVGRSEVEGLSILEARSQDVGHIGDALVEDKKPRLFARNVGRRATPQLRSTEFSTKTRRDADAHDAFESFAWSIGDPDGGSDFLEGLHRTVDVSRGAPLIDSLRSAESLEVLLLVMRKMQLDDRSAASAANRSDSATRASRSLDRTTTSSALRTTARRRSLSRDVERLSGTARTRRVLDLRHATHHQRARHLSSRALPLHQCVHVLTPRAKHLVEFLQHLTWPAIKWRRRWRRQ